MKMVYDEKLRDYICCADTPVFSVREVVAKPDYTLILTFSNGEKKLYDASQLLKSEIFAPLKNPALFLRAHIDGVAVAWNNEIDVAPEFLYENSVSC